MYRTVTLAGIYRHENHQRSRLQGERNQSFSLSACCYQFVFVLCVVSVAVVGVVVILLCLIVSVYLIRGNYVK